MPVAELEIRRGEGVLKGSILHVRAARPGCMVAIAPPPCPPLEKPEFTCHAQKDDIARPRKRPLQAVVQTSTFNVWLFSGPVNLGGAGICSLVGWVMKYARRAGCMQANAMALTTGRTAGSLLMPIRHAQEASVTATVNRVPL